jgi:hypothetical protein
MAAGHLIVTDFLLLLGRWMARPKLSTSLRANGSRECAPDDRLREAIQNATKEDWIASSQALLAMTGWNAARKQESPRHWRGLFRAWGNNASSPGLRTDARR